MRSTYRINKFKETLIKKQEKGLRTKEIREIKESINTSFVNVTSREILLNGIMINIVSEDFTAPVTFEVEHDFPYIKVHFEIEGYSQYIPNNSKSVPVIIKSGHYNFFYLPEVKGTLTYNTKTRKSFEIVVTEEYLKEIFKDNFYKVSTGFGEALKNEEPFTMFSQNEPIPPNLLLIIDDIIFCSYQKEIKQVYIESKIKEIFSHLFSEINLEKSRKQIHKLNKVELDQILNAERILKENMGNSLTVEKLAMLTGLNQHKLKRQFKSVFNEPIFSYLTNVRMDKAKKMLTTEEMNVSEVAYAVGYKNPQHFTAAFKKKFNYLPSELKKRPGA
ncbi:helix-turn-helix domain-containing protein [Aquimarina sediminis]|uniref:helix-turn-helix domain-containing protein n=1 Tax=Aquimarina sediminis TaxID=2070536 RepID=UPI000CA08ED7|nr:AraC family transcriptional regulator [Aquimarina sediminis]